MTRLLYKLYGHMMYVRLCVLTVPSIYAQLIDNNVKLIIDDEPEVGYYIGYSGY